VTAIGDSVMIDATPNLQAVIPGIVVNAAVSRYADEGVAIVAQLLATGQLGRSVVFALSTNGTFTLPTFAKLVQLTQGRHLVVVTAHCGYCSWVASNNAMIWGNCSTATHCTVGDWYTLAQEHPTWFADEPAGVHMPIGGLGGQAYAVMVRQALAA
jgi:hypothetical protein